MRVNRKQAKLPNQKGQALIEYLALLFIGTLMVLGLVYQFNDAFKQYLDAWFNSDEGGYLFCLIQNGYLPGEAGSCPLPQFNLKNGKTKSSIGGTANAGGSNANSSKSSSTSGSNSLSGLGGESGSGRRGLISAGSNFGGKGRGASGGGGAKESTGNADSSSSSPVFGKSGSTGANLQTQNRSRFIPIREDDSEGGAVTQKTIPATEKDLKPQSRFVAEEKKRQKAQEDEDFNSKFTFGKILKYLIIIFILFSIFFFIGSQVLAISQGGKNVVNESVRLFHNGKEFTPLTKQSFNRV